MRTHVALDHLIDLEERVGRLYIRFFRKFADLPGIANLWWEMALEEHEHAGVLKMVKELADRKGEIADIRHRLRPLQATIESCERRAGREVTLPQALAMAVHLERSELDRLGRDTVHAIGGAMVPIPKSAFAPHEAHLGRLMRTVRKFGGEEVLREAWDLRPEVRHRPVLPAGGNPTRGGESDGRRARPARGGTRQPGGHR
ncbi:MAG TPA: hypothetical protein VLH58_00665 [Candidatus Methylomirabilis sp.]|nr:hypothetical protein [Candidatus Methylomirabilis sp.]HSC69832.1 hypothetical protein [Candidatus Methylomirabilis sp.]